MNTSLRSLRERPSRPSAPLRPSPARPRARRVRPRYAALGALLSLSLPAAAQSTFLVSTGADYPGPPAVDDAELVRLEPGAAARVQLGAGHWAATTGVLPGDVDALGLRRSQPPGSHGRLAFSFLSNEQGFEDGDVLGLAAGGGLEVLVPEADLAAALGVAGTGIDVDAIAFDDADRLIFSLQSDEPATVLGPVENGDVLRLEADGSVTRLATEADVQAALLIATGETGAVGDVHGVDWFGGELVVVTQGPSSVDGGAFSVGAQPAVVLDEAVAGLAGEELDGFAILEPGDDLGRLELAPQLLTPGAPVQARYDGAAPGAPLLVLWSGNAGYVGSPLPGFAGWYLDPADPYLGAALATGAVVVLVADAGGSASFDFDAPLGDLGGAGWSGGAGWTFQVLDVAALEVSAPFRVEF